MQGCSRPLQHPTAGGTLKGAFPTGPHLTSYGDDPLGVLFNVFRALTYFLVINYLVNFTFCLFFCVRAYAGHLCHGACMKVRGQLVGVNLSLHSVGSGDERTSGGHPLSHLIGP